MLVFEFDRELGLDQRRGFRRAEVLGEPSARRESSPATTSPSARAAPATSSASPSWPRAHGIAAEAVRPVLPSGERVSSGRIRDALIEGDTGDRDAAADPPLCDRGRGRARRPARPRARLSRPPISRLGDYQRPRYGIYAVRVRLDDGSEHAAVANLGVRPTFEPPQRIARSASVRFRRRPLRPHDRGRAPPLHPPRGEVRRMSTALDRRRCGEAERYWNRHPGHRADPLLHRASRRPRTSPG